MNNLSLAGCLSEVKYEDKKSTGLEHPGNQQAGAIPCNIILFIWPGHSPAAPLRVTAQCTSHTGLPPSTAPLKFAALFQ